MKCQCPSGTELEMGPILYSRRKGRSYASKAKHKELSRKSRNWGLVGKTRSTRNRVAKASDCKTSHMR